MTLELSLSLSQARLSRGLTLEDAERSTRIARKFLVALEEHDYSVFPAPVYARGFLRTYCRYLGIDPEIQLAELPAGWTANTPTTHLPPVSHPFTINTGWLFAGAIIAAVLVGGYFISQMGSPDLGDLDSLRQQEGQNTGPQIGIEASGDNATNNNNAVVGRALDPGQPGILPNFGGVSVDSAVAYLDQQSIDYVLVDTPDTSVPAEVIISQAPAAGAATVGTSRITLAVSVGATPTTSLRANCATLADATRLSNAEQVYFADNCTTPPAVSPDRTNCEEIRGTEYRSTSEREFFLANCITG